MNVFAETGKLVQWILGVLRQFFRVTSRTTFTVITYSVIARVTRMLAFLLPLKVILLAGSEGVPRYFQLFIRPDQKDAGVIVLSAAAIVSYALTLLLEARSKRLSEQGSAALLAASGVMSVVANQRDQAQGFYGRFTQVASAVLFAAIALLALSLLDWLLALYVVGLVSCFYLLTAWALHGVTVLKRTRLSDFVTLRLGNYLGVLSAVGFLSSFLVILYPFLAGTNGNILVAIICVVLLRQMLSAMTSAIRDVVSLAEKRYLIDALVFPDRQLQLAEKKDTRTLRELFGRQDRERLATGKLADLAQPGQGFRVEWRDPLLRGTAEFAVALEGGEHPARHFRQRVFPPRLRHMVENEELLFSHIERETVWAPPLVKRFFHGEYECLVWAAGAGMPPNRKQWPALESDFLVNLWSVEPPPALLRIYSSSHSFLHERLTDEFAARMDIAIDDDREAAALERFRKALPAIRALLAGMPLRLVNPDFRRENVVAVTGGGFHVLGWGQWSLEPLGGGRLKLPGTEDGLDALLDLARARYPTAIPASVTAHHVLLAGRCGLIERAILSGTMKAGLKVAAQVLHDFKALNETSEIVRES